MSHQALSIAVALERLGRRDPTLKMIYLFSQQLTDAEVAELANCLLAHPDVVTILSLAYNQLTDETGSSWLGTSPPAPSSKH